MTIRTDFSDPESRNSIFVAFKRTELERVDFQRALATGEEVALAHAFIGLQRNLCGVVTNITSYSDGQLITIEPKQPALAFNWHPVPLWIPTAKDRQGGVLCNWESSGERKRRNRQMSFAIRYLAARANHVPVCAER